MPILTLSLPDREYAALQTLAAECETALNRVAADLLVEAERRMLAPRLSDQIDLDYFREHLLPEHFHALRAYLDQPEFDPLFRVDTAAYADAVVEAIQTVIAFHDELAGQAFVTQTAAAALALPPSLVG
jgi:hypothetical protein